MSALILFEAAKEALAAALRVDEVLKVKGTAEQIKLYGRLSKDKRIIADGTALQLRAERKLGQLLRSAHQAGQLGYGRPKSNIDGRTAPDVENGAEAEPLPERVTLSEVGVDKKLSSKAQRWAALGDAEFEAKLLEVREKIEAGGAVVLNPLRDLSTAEKKTKRAEREAALGKKQMALPVAKFGVIYADPEWKFEVRSDGGLDRSADNHYPTSGLAEIKERDVGSLAADDCVLFLWVTVPMLRHGLDVLEAWGFEYKSNFNWHKDRIGTGYWNRNRHEHLLIGTRGGIMAPAMGDQFDSSIEAKVGEHSAKPEKFYEIIEAYFPTLPKIELNARVARPGWARWGYEAPEELVTERAPVEPAETRAGDGNGLRLKGKATLAHPSVGSRDSGSLAEGLGTTQREDGASPAPSPFTRFDDASDAILRRHYALPVEQFDLGAAAAEIGCSTDQAKKRASHLKLGSRERQRALASAYTAGQHARGEL